MKALMSSSFNSGFLDLIFSVRSVRTKFSPKTSGLPGPSIDFLIAAATFSCTFEMSVRYVLMYPSLASEPIPHHPNLSVIVFGTWRALAIDTKVALAECSDQKYDARILIILCESASLFFRPPMFRIWRVSAARSAGIAPRFVNASLSSVGRTIKFWRFGSAFLQSFKPVSSHSSSLKKANCEMHISLERDFFPGPVVFDWYKEAVMPETFVKKTDEGVIQVLSSPLRALQKVTSFNHA